jgi:hypothetical protein
LPSRLFEYRSQKAIEQAVARVIGTEAAFLSEVTARSPRGVGDAVQDIVARRWQEICPDAADTEPNLGRRAMGDVTFEDVDGYRHTVDVKTHRVGTAFSMPNLTSVERLNRLYNDRLNYFDVLLVRYRVSAAAIAIEEVHFSPIEWVPWEFLTIGNLGKGQIQIKNSNRYQLDSSQSRKTWMTELMRRLTDDYYPREMAKIERLRAQFLAARGFWEASVPADVEP